MRTFILAAAASIAMVGPAAAQSPAELAMPARADFHAVVGWQNLRAPGDGDELDTFGSNNNWANGIFFGGAGAGWYWTEHLKTQLDFGGGTRGRHYRSRQFTINGQPPNETSRVAIQKQSLAVSQQYQFFRNQWFHPHVGAGLDIARETTREEYQPVFAYDPVARTSRQISGFRVEGPHDRAVVRPFAEIGFKAYMSRRAFFTGDSRIMVRGGIEEVLFRVGFGVDF
jgi:hypothetical protein